MLLRRLRRFFTENLENEEILAERKYESYSGIISPKKHLYAKEYDLKKLDDVPLNFNFQLPPSLQHGLNSIVRTEGIYSSDQFPSYLKTIPKISEKLYNRISNYARPSSDKKLYTLGLQYGAKYITGSSSLTETLQQIFFVISNFKSPDITGLGSNYDHSNMNYMSAYRKPITFLLRKLPGGIYAIDGDNGPIEEHTKILIHSGVILESLFTTDKPTFERICNTDEELSESDRNSLDRSSKSFRYRKVGNLIIRSQLDTSSVDENGVPFVFEIKTRATAPIRYDLKNYENYLDYKLAKRNGLHSSYEREYFDLIRSILLKYFFQISLGKMDGAFISYHNTQEIFGFEYLSLREIEKRLFGSPEISEQILKICLGMFQDLLDDIIEKFPDAEVIKVGVFANFKAEELLTTLEPHEKAFEYSKDPEVFKLIEDEVDYYKAFFPNKTAYALSRRIFPYINGILQKEPLFLEKGDKLTFKIVKYNKGVMEFQDYMYFLHNAYKFESMTYHKDFIGTWKKFNDFHIYRKQIYRSLASN
jgi:Mitochondrial protein Pet127